MSSRYELDIPEHLDAEQTRVAIDLVTDLLDLLVRHLRRIEPPRPDEWHDPPWLDEKDDP